MHNMQDHGVPHQRNDYRSHEEQQAVQQIPVWVHQQKVNNPATAVRPGRVDWDSGPRGHHRHSIPWLHEGIRQGTTWTPATQTPVLWYWWTNTQVDKEFPHRTSTESEGGLSSIGMEERDKRHPTGVCSWTNLIRHIYQRHARSR